MWINKTESATSLCAVMPVIEDTHPTQVGLIAVRGTVSGSRPRNTQRTGAYGTSVKAISVPAAQGSLMATAFAPATAKADGVPPRGRPV